MRICTPPVAEVGLNRRIEFRYDYLHRRVLKRYYANGGTELTSGRRYLYDGWNVIAEYEDTGVTALGTLKRTYTWGLDIARSLSDAGGVGALLQIRDHSLSKDYLPAYDGNGNVAALFDASDGTVAAAYEYSPYGEFLRCEGTYARENSFKFSTKFTDDESGLVYYGRRYYSPSQGRFLRRDPKNEKGGLNLYGFCRNNSINLWDVLGMKPDWDGIPGDVVTILEEIEPGVFAYVTYRWEFIETGSNGGEVDIYDWVQVGRPMPAGGRDSSGAGGSGNATRGMPEVGSLYGTGLAMIPGFPFSAVVGTIFKSAPPRPPFEFIGGGLIDNEDWNLYLGLRYTGNQRLAVEITVVFTWTPTDKSGPVAGSLRYGPIYSDLNARSQTFPAGGISYKQIVPINNGPNIEAGTLGYLGEEMKTRGVTRDNTSGTIIVTLRYTGDCGPVVRGGLDPADSQFFWNEDRHNYIGSRLPYGFNQGNPASQKIIINWGPTGTTMMSNIPMGINRDGRPLGGKVIEPIPFPIP